MKTISLIIPPSLFLADERVFVSLGILKVAAVLEKAGYVVEVLDLSGVDNYLEVLKVHFSTSRARFIGITCTTPQFPSTRKIIETLREIRSDFRICLGGPHVTAACASYKLNGENSRSAKDFHAIEKLADVFVSGDGEEAIFRAIEDKESRWVDADDPETSLFLKSEDLASYPFPARHLVDLPSYRYSIEGEVATSVVMQLGCPFPCVSENTLLGVPQGLFYPNEAYFTDWVVCPEKHIHHLGQIGSYPIVKTGRKKCLRVTLANGIVFTLTPNHPILSVENEHLKWTPAGNCEVGTYVALGSNYNCIREEILLPPPSHSERSGRQYKFKKISIPARLDTDLAWLTGFMIGDGCLPVDNRPSFHFVVTPELEEIVQGKLEKCFGIRGTLSTHTQSEKVKHLWVHSIQARKVFTECVGINPLNKLRVPQTIRKSPKPVVEAFLAGLWAADGYSPKNQASYLTTVSEELSQEIASLALWVGYGAAIYGPIPASRNIPNSKPTWRIFICKETCWTDTQGHPCWTSTIPLDKRRIYRSKKSGHLHWRTSTGRKRSSVTRTLLEELDPNHPLLAGQFIYVPIKNIEDAGEHWVYDMEAEDTHYFSANGATVHNCGFCGMRLSPSFRRVRLRDSSNVIEEIRQVYQTYGFRGFFFLDDELNVNKNFLYDLKGIIALQEKLGVDFHLRGFIKSNLFNEIQAASMKKAGFKQILIGFEAADERILLNIKKKATLEQNTRCMEIAHKYGLKVKALMSAGHPGESPETVGAIRDWLIKVEPADFDLTTITVYPSTPYFDQARQINSDTWVYTAETGDRLYSCEVDFSTDGSYYKGIPGEYKSYVYTDKINAEELVKMRNWVEEDVRNKLKIPFYQITPATRFEASMGQLPGSIFRTTNG